MIPTLKFGKKRMNLFCCCCCIIQEYLKQLNSQIGDIVELVRGKLNKGARITLGALTTLDVHGKSFFNIIMSNQKYLVPPFEVTIALL